MKPINGFQCELCFSLYSNEAEAVSCETSHPKIDSLKITRLQFSKVEGSYGFQRGHNIRIPERLVIKFSENFGDVGTYVLERWGPKGI